MRRVILALMVMMLALPAVAEDVPEGPPAKHKVIAFLGLDEDQVTRWDALIEDTQAAVAPLQEELDGVEVELRELLAGEAPDATAVGELVLQGQELKRTIGEAHLGYVKGFQLILTNQQIGRFLSVRRAARLQPVLPAFRVFHLLPR